MDGLSLVSGNGTPLINGLTNDVDDSTKSLRSHGDHDGIAGVVDNLASNQTLCTIHGNGSDGVLSQVLGNLQDELGLTVLNLQGVEDLWESIFKLDVNNGSDDGDNLALGKSSGGCGGAYRQISSLSYRGCGKDLGHISSLNGLFNKASSGTACSSQHLFKLTPH